MERAWVLFIFWPLAFLILRYRRAIKEFTGPIGFAEKFLGMGGTNTFIVLLGILVAILSLMYAMGTLQGIMKNFLGPLFG